MRNDNSIFVFRKSRSVNFGNWMRVEKEIELLKKRCRKHNRHFIFTEHIVGLALRNFPSGNIIFIFYFFDLSNSRLVHALNKWKSLRFIKESYHKRRVWNYIEIIKVFCMFITLRRFCLNFFSSLSVCLWKKYVV